MRRGLLLIGSIAAIAAVAWLAAFGATSPCDALRSEASHVAVTEGQTPEVKKAVSDALGGFSGIQCIGMAVRLKAGDTSIIRVVVVDQRRGAK